ncbi:MAG: cyclopropane-fatty-acyl-phospholipid synthase family protein [Candidatus Thiodiazotropha sp.]
MNSLTQSLTPPASPWTARPLLRLLEGIRMGTLKLITPEGLTLQFGTGSEPRAELRLKHWSSLRIMFRSGDLGLARCYREGLVETDDLTALLRLAIRNLAPLQPAVRRNRLLDLVYRLRHRLRINTRRGSARNIEAHYDLGNDFYACWLDDTMTYSSACFDSSLHEPLSIAQARKYRQILQLSGAETGDRILEIGCGWGGFAEYAARRDRDITGITLSPRQLEYARQRIDQAQLGSRARFELRDYRDLSGQYDHIVSIEMFEAVGEAYWDAYFLKLHELLNPGGRAAIQTIVIDDQHFERYRRRTDFIQQYIFPGGMLPSPGVIKGLAQRHGFSIEGMSRYGSHYAETLRRWRHQFEEQKNTLAGQGFDESFQRLWKFYLSYCEAGFDEQRIDLLQFALVKAQN